MKTSFTMQNMKRTFATLMLVCSMMLTSHWSVGQCTITLVDSTVSLGCSGGATGQAFIGAAGGHGPYQFKKGINGSWLNSNYFFPYQEAFFNLAAGIDTFYVKDSVGCTQSIAINIPLAVTDTATYANLGGGHFLFTTHTSAWRPLFRWGVDGSGWVQNTYGFNNFINLTLSAGTHTIVASVYDTATNCTVYDTVLVNASCILSVSINDSLSTNFGGGYPIIVGEARGFSGFPTYQWSDGSTGENISNPIIGATYCVTITDPNTGCTASTCQTVCRLNATVRDSVGPSTNTFTVVPSGHAPYRTAWDANMYWYVTPPAYVTSNTAGTVHLLVVDSNGCYFLDTLQTTSCALTGYTTQVPSGNNEIVTAHVSGGAGVPANYTYNWSYYTTFTPGATIGINNNGDYTVTVTDSIGCSVVLRDTVTGLPCSVQAYATPSYLGNGQYEFTGNNTGSTRPLFHWSIDEGNTLYTPYSANYYQIFQTLTPGLHSIVLMVLDSGTNCFNEDSITVNVPAFCNIQDSISYINSGGLQYTFTAHTNAQDPHFLWRNNFGSWQQATYGYNNSITLTLNAGINYIVSSIYDTATGCAVYDTIMLNTTASAGPNQIICGRSTATMAATGTGTWTAWGSNPTAVTIANSSSPITTISGMTASGIYGFVWHTSGGAWDSVTVTVNPVVNFSISQYGDICSGTDTLAVAGAGYQNYSINWFRNGIYLNHIVPIFVNGSTAGLYSVILSNTTGCWDSVSINVAPCQNVYTNISATICGGTYLFNGQTLSQSGTYRDTLNASSGLDSIVILNLTVNPSLNLTISQRGNICTGNDTLTVSGAGANTITWVDNGVIVTPSNSTYSPHTVAGGNGSGSAANQFNLPYGVSTDAAGNIYVLDQTNNRVQKFPATSTSATNGVTVAGGNGSGAAANQLNQAYGLHLDANGNIYIADSYNNRVIKFPAGSTSATSGTVVAGGNGAGSAANQLHTPTDIDFDATGNMYVCDFANHRIQKFAAGSTSASNGTTVAGGNGAGSAANQLNDPIGVFIDATGIVYVADQHNHRIQKFPAGSTSATSGTTVAGGNGMGTAANQLDYPNDMIVDASGSLYVDDYNGHRIQRFPAGSTSATNGVTIIGGQGSGSNQLNDPSRFHLDAYGNMFISDEANNRVQKVQISNPLANSYVATTQGTYLAIASNGSGCSDTVLAHVVCANSVFTNISASVCQGNSYSFNGQQLASAGTYRDTLYTVGGADSIVTLTLTVNPTPSISISQAGSVCTGGDTLTVSGASGSTVSWIGNGNVIGGNSSFSVYTIAGGNGSGSAANQFKVPYGVQADAAGNTYVLDQGNNRVQKFAPGSTSATNGVTVAGGNGSGSALNQFNRPYGFYVDAAGNIYIADTYNHRVLKFGPGSTSATSGTIVAGGNGQGNAAAQLSIPTDIDFDAAGNMYVCDYGNHRIQKFPAGSTSATSGFTAAGGNGSGQALNQLNLPIGVYISATGTIYVADQHNHRIMRFPAGSSSSTLGQVVAGSTVGNGGSASNQLQYPNDMMLDAAGNMYVCDYQNSRIQKFAPNSTAGSNGVTVAGSAGYGSGTYQFKFDNRFYLDGSGNMYISDEGNNRIQKYGSNVSTTAFVATTPGTYTAVATNSSGCSDTVSVTLAPCLSDSVWPGDANHDGLDDNTDLLPLGLAYGLNGIARVDQSIVWSAHYAQDWGVQFLNGTNTKHADCNGDGVIDANDTTAILLNFGFTHNKNYSSSPWRSGIPGITIQYSKDTVVAGDTLVTSLILGDSLTTVNNIYGLAFTYHYDALVVDSTTSSFGFINSFLGNSVNKMSIHKDFKTDGIVKAAVTGINHINRSGYGTIAHFISTITTGNINGKDLSYYTNICYITDVTAIDRDGNPVPLNTGLSTNQVGYVPTGIHDISYDRILLYPNPTKSGFTIQANNTLADIDYTVSDVTGRVILTGKLAGELTHVSMGDMADGVYMLRLGDQKQSYKIIKE